MLFNNDSAKEKTSGLTEIVMILDRSGSMSGLEEDTIGGFNSFIKRQQALKGDAICSVILFDDETEVICDRKPVKKIGKMKKRIIGEEKV